MRAIAILATLVVMSLAGCADSGTAEVDPDEDVFNTITPEEPQEEGKGLIRGIVITETLTPIVNATVRIVGQEMSTKTNDNGAFIFSNLEPAPYFLEASKPGFETAQTSTIVEADVLDPTIVKIPMAEDPETRPFYVPFYYELFVSCSFKAANYVFTAGDCDPTGVAGYAATDDSWQAFDTGTTQNASWYQSEIDWEANQPASDGMVTIQCAAKDTSGAHCNSGASADTRLCNTRGSSPLVCRIGLEGTPPGGGNNLVDVKNGEGFTGEFAVQMYSNCAYSCLVGVAGLGVALEQKINFFAFVFYNYAPPEDWSFLDTDKVPAPPS